MTSNYDLQPRTLLRLNGRQLGLVQEFFEELQVELEPVHAMGSGQAQALLPRERSYSLGFRRLLPDPGVLQALGDLQSLQGFDLEFVLGSRVILFTGCEFSLLRISSTAAGSVVEEARLRALSRTEG